MKVQKFFIRNFKIIAMIKIGITFYHALSLLIAPSHNLSPTLEKKPFSFENFKMRFITSYHALSLLITPYPQGWKQNYFHLSTLKLVPRLQIFYHI